MEVHPALFGGGGRGRGAKNRGHYYSSLQLTYTFKTRTKDTKTHTAAFISAAILSAATKLRRLVLCAFIVIHALNVSRAIWIYYILKDSSHVLCARFALVIHSLV